MRTDLTALVKRRAFGDARQLLTQGVDVDTPGRNGETALLWAVIHGEEALVSELLEAGASPTPRTRGKRGPGNGSAGATPLHFATNPGSIEILRRLLAAGAETNAEDAVGRSPLSAAAAIGNIEAVEELLAGGADPNHTSVPILHAVQGGHVSVVKRLLKSGAQHTPQSTQPYPPLRLAVIGGHREIAELLRGAGACWEQPQ